MPEAPSAAIATPTCADADIAVCALRRDPLANSWLQRSLCEQYLLFDACVGGERRVDLYPLLLSHGLHLDAVQAATAIYQAVVQVAGRAHQDPLEQKSYGLPEDACRLAAASFAGKDEAALVRVDLLLGEDGIFRACEINADCPGGHNEATGLPALAQSAGFWEGLNPTRLLDALVARLIELAQRPGPGCGTIGLIYATAYAEDLQVCALVRQALLARGVKAVLASPTAPKVVNGVTYLGEQPVAVLYRYFPTEYMEGQRNLEALCTALRGGALRTLSSFAHIYTQSKLALARTWQCAEQGELAVADTKAVARHLPETREFFAVPSAQLCAEQPRWVLKRALGRVGDEVFVGELFSAEDWPRLVAAVHTACTQHGERWIAQRYVPQRRIATPFGERLVTLGVYLLDGQFVGYFARLTAYSHVSHEALCLPVFTRPEEC